MIKQINNLSFVPFSAESVKLFEIYKCYFDIAMFWHQEGTDIYISLLDGNMIISGNNGDFSELGAFIETVNPNSIFSNIKILKSLKLKGNIQIVNVLKTVSKSLTADKSDIMSSKEVFGILTNSGLQIDAYDYFATDFCLRLNKDRLKYFGVKEKAVAVAIGDNKILVNAVASLQKGLGSFVLKSLISNFYDKEIYVCCEDSLKSFYLKNGFKFDYFAGYWRKQ